MQTYKTYSHKVHLFTKYHMQHMSPRRNWESPTHGLASECASPPPEPKGRGADSPAGLGLGESQFRRLEKKLSTLPTLCLQGIDLFVENSHISAEVCVGGSHTFGTWNIPPSFKGRLYSIWICADKKYCSLRTGRLIAYPTATTVSRIYI